MEKSDKKRVEGSNRKTDSNLSKQNQFLNSVINSVTDPIVVIGTDFQIHLMNQAARNFAGISNKVSINNLRCYQVVLGLNRPCHSKGRQCALIEVLESGSPMTVEHKHVLPNGQKRIYEILASPLEDEDGTLLGIAESFRDITEHKVMEADLQKAHDELEHRVKERTAVLLKNNDILREEIEERQQVEGRFWQAKEQSDLMCQVVPSAIFTVDLDKKITSWNHKAEMVTGYKKKEIVGKKCDVFSLKPCTEICGIYSDDIQKPIVGKECEILTKSGEIRVITKNANLIHDETGKVIGGVESFEDVTDSKHMESQLRSERDKFMSMLAALGQGMHILNSNFDIEYQNDVLRKHFGDKLGQKCYQVYKQRDEPCEVCRMHEAIETNEIQRTEEVMSDGKFYEQSYAPFRDVDGETKALILLRDITEEKAYQAETMRAGQLASIGELAAGVAHEINNPVNGIINYAQILIDEAGKDESQTELLYRVINEGERVADIVSNLLSFARQQDDDVEDVQLSIVVEETLALVHHQLVKDSISVTANLPYELPHIFANPQQLKQVFLNLLSNARHALNQRYSEKTPQKKIEINCKEVKIDNKPFIQLTFTDWGQGISKEIIKNIFDPFFSSKKPGEGTGLGLSISHGIIKDFHGHLRAESKEGDFTTMIVELPIHQP